jgi:hypothetical protein
MSNPDSPQARIAAIRAQLEAAHKEVSRVCREGGSHAWRMTIPVQPTDSDVIIGGALRSAKAFLDALATAQAAQPSPCEWRSASPGGPIVWSGCIDKWDQRWMQRHAIKDWKACPYCAAPLTLAEVPHV